MPENSLKLLITKELSENMRLSQNLTLSEALSRGLIESLTIKFVLKPEINIKHKKLIQKFK
ncbi:hypothetical protein N8083_02340, partial [Candidatus Pacebacteria bacterium]|nr:hypothetical protein [Candidatus Paceibacterota bacterium]